MIVQRAFAGWTASRRIAQPCSPPGASLGTGPRRKRGHLNGGPRRHRANGVGREGDLTRHRRQGHDAPGRAQRGMARQGMGGRNNKREGEVFGFPLLTFQGRLASTLAIQARRGPEDYSGSARPRVRQDDNGPLRGRRRGRCAGPRRPCTGVPWRRRTKSRPERPVTDS